MNKTKWDLLRHEEKHKLIASCVMQWKGPGMPEQLAKIEHLNETTFFKFPLHESECQGWVLAKGQYVYDLSDYRFTTDRNACALVLDEIERRGVIVKGEMSSPLKLLFTHLLVNEVIEEVGERTYIGRNWEVVRADPDTICYCAVKAVEENGTDESNNESDAVQDSRAG